MAVFDDTRGNLIQLIEAKPEANHADTRSPIGLRDAQRCRGDPWPLASQGVPQSGRLDIYEKRTDVVLSERGFPPRMGRHSGGSRVSRRPSGLSSASWFVVVRPDRADEGLREHSALSL